MATYWRKASWERFRDGILMLRMKKGIKGGCKTPPHETPMAVHTLLP
jgi:hypothetical protein